MSQSISKKYASVVFLLIATVTSVALGFDQQEFKKFTDNLTLSDGALAQFSLFKYRNAGLPDGYPQEFLKTMRSKVLSETASALKRLDQNCVESVKVDFLNSLSPESSSYRKNAVVQDFESGIVRIEVSACFKKATPIQIMRLFADPKFQTEAISTIVSSEQKGRLVCDHTNVFSIGKSSYCYEPTISETPSLALNHHYNVWNAPLHEAPIPVYFRELFVTTHSTAKARAFHLVAYVRSVKIGSFKRFFAQSSIKSEQAKSMNLLKEKLGEF